MGWLIFDQWSEMNGHHLTHKSNYPFFKAGRKPKVSCDYGHMTNISDFPQERKTISSCASRLLLDVMVSALSD